MPSQLEVAVQSLTSFWSQLMRTVPHFFVGLLLFVLGILLARIIRAIFVRLMKTLRFDVVAEKAGLEEFLVRGGLHRTSLELLGDLVYWVLLFVFALAILSSLGLDIAGELFRSFVLFVPNLVLAIMILVFGTLAARIARGGLYSSLKTSGIAGAEVVSSVAYWIVVMLVVSAALQEISIGGQVLVAAFEIAFGGLCLGLAIAFGLAGKEWAAQILEKLWRHSR